MGWSARCFSICVSRCHPTEAATTGARNPQGIPGTSRSCGKGSAERNLLWVCSPHVAAARVVACSGLSWSVGGGMRCGLCRGAGSRGRIARAFMDALAVDRVVQPLARFERRRGRGREVDGLAGPGVPGPARAPGAGGEPAEAREGDGLADHDRLGDGLEDGVDRAPGLGSDRARRGLRRGPQCRAWSWGGLVERDWGVRRRSSRCVRRRDRASRGT